jgi:hypothetical protein
VKTVILPFCVWLLAGFFCTQADAEVVSARSVSGQFQAWEIQPRNFGPAPKAVRTSTPHGSLFLVVSRPLPAGTNGARISLEPPVLVISCERLKQLFLAEMGLTDRWRGQVKLFINPELTEEQGPQLTAVHDPDGWSYELRLPKTMRVEILQQALVQTLLLELVNRKAGDKTAEVPMWLADGLSAHLEAYNLPTFLLQPGVQMVGNNVRLEGTDLVRDELRRHAPLTFQELNWPQESDTTGEGLKLYRCCAQLFLEQLLQLPDGKQCLRRMLDELPEHLNWQTAFLDAFRAHFDRLLDVEKWWGLVAVDFAGAGANPSWDGQQSWTRLNSALDVPVSVRFDTGHVPVDARLTLQEVIAKWPALDAGEALRRTITDLQSMQAPIRPEYRLLAMLYLKTLQNYLNESEQEAAHPRPLGKNPPSAIHVLKANTIEQLDELDRQRAALRPPTAKADSQLSETRSAASSGGH